MGLGWWEETWGPGVSSCPEALVPVRVTLWVPSSLGSRHLRLSSSALTQEPDIHFPEPMKSGYATNLTCSLRGSCEEGRPLSFFWVGGALDSLDRQTLRSSVLTLTPRVQDHGSNLTCQVHLPEGQGTVKRTIRLNVSCECWRDGWVPQSSEGKRVSPGILFPEEIGGNWKAHPFHLWGSWNKGLKPTLPLTTSSLLRRSTVDDHARFAGKLHR